jgi:hypothetical protein
MSEPSTWRLLPDRVCEFTDGHGLRLRAPFFRESGKRFDLIEYSQDRWRMIRETASDLMKDHALLQGSGRDPGTNQGAGQARFDPRIKSEGMLLLTALVVHQDCMARSIGDKRG